MFDVLSMIGYDWVTDNRYDWVTDNRYGWVTDNRYDWVTDNPQSDVERCPSYLGCATQLCTHSLPNTDDSLAFFFAV